MGEEKGRKGHALPGDGQPGMRGGGWGGRLRAAGAADNRDKGRRRSRGRAEVGPPSHGDRSDVSASDGSARP